MRRAIIGTGGRKYMNRQVVEDALDRIWPDFVIVGDAFGADKLIRDWCNTRQVDHMICFAHWRDTVPKEKAGPDRNKRMARYAYYLFEMNGVDIAAVLHFPGNNGTANMVKMGRDYNLTVLDGLHVADFSAHLSYPWDGQEMHQDGKIERPNPEWRAW